MAVETVVVDSVNEHLKAVVNAFKFLEAQGTELINILSLKLNEKGEQKLCSKERKILQAVQSIKDYIGGDILKAVYLTRLGYSVTFFSNTVIQIKKAGFMLCVDFSITAVKGNIKEG